MRRIVGLVLLATTAAMAQDPVPPGMVSGRTLTASLANFAIDAPQGWEWVRMDMPEPKGAAYACRRPGSTDMFIVGHEAGSFHRQLASSEAEQFVRGVREGLEKQGAKTREATVTQSEVPRAGSFRFTFAADVRGTRVHMFGYVFFLRETVYQMSCGALQPAEPPEFDAFARSFRLLREPTAEEESAPNAACGITFVYLALLGAGYAVAASLRFLKGRPVARGSHVGLAFVVLAWVAIIFFITTRPHLDSKQMNYYVGYQSGAGLPVFVLAVYLSYRARKKKPT